MKKIMTVLMCFQLITAPLANVGLASDKDNIPQTNISYDQASQHAGGYDFYLKQILALSTGVIGANIITQCHKGMTVPSIAVYMAGAVANVASELLGSKSQNERHKARMSEIEVSQKFVKENVSGGEFQKEALNQRLKEEKDTRDYLKDRATWQTAISAIYWTAMGLAIAEQMTGYLSATAAANAACLAASVGPQAAMAAGCPATVILGTQAAQAAGPAGNPAPRTAGMGTCAPLTFYAPFCIQHLEAYLKFTYGACALQPTDGGASMLSMTKILGMGWQVANTSFGGPEGKMSTVSMVTSLLTMMVPKLSKTVAASYNFPIARSITFGASAGLSTAVSVGLWHRHGVAKKNVEKLERAVNQFVRETTETEGFETGTKEQLSKNAVVKSGAAYKSLAKGVETKSCLQRKGSSYDYSAKACNDALKLKPVHFNYSGVGPDVLSVSGMAADFANATSSGDMAQANLIAGKLAAQAGNMKRFAEKMQEAYNKQLPKNEKPVEFEKSIESQVASMQASLQKSATGQEMDLASMGSTDAKLLDEQKNDAKVESVTATAPSVPEVPVAPDFDFSLDEVNENVQDEQVATISNRLEDFETNENDISKRSDVSIFTQLSNRYLLNYTRIFETKRQLKEAAPE